MTHSIKKILPVCLLGALAGFLNGLLGAGGGIPLVLGLRALLGKKVANGTKKRPLARNGDQIDVPRGHTALAREVEIVIGADAMQQKR